ncbi:MAG TPA: aminotransferase class I/II-fold pyridoxal phosphate-dependent enzyme [Bacteroidales bacterium]|nr:aminotransferase class I/II-fold pyridoxal phosphate-dependent enzyme [Bacteroidales bacterium]
MKSKIWLSPPHMSGEEMRYIQDAFDTNWIAPAGPNIEGFEQELAKFTNCGYVAALSSGTSAIHLALIILGIKRGDRVLCSSFTFSASVNPVVYCNATPVLIDSESVSWNIDPRLLEKAIIESLKDDIKPKAILVTHLYGMPAKIDEIKAISKMYQIPVIEDAAEALGATYKGQHVGTFGDIGILSFNGNKIITTSGGGAMISNDKEIIQRAKFLSTQARDEAPHYQHSEIGYNYRMSNIVAGIGRGQLEVIDERVKMRRELNTFYRIQLQDVPGIFFQTEGKDQKSNFWLTTILVDPDKTNGVTRNDLMEELDKENIETRPLWKPMHLQPVFQNYPSYENGNSEHLFNIGLCLPSGTNMSDDDKKKIVGIIRKKLGYEEIKWPQRSKQVLKVPFSPPRMDAHVVRSVEKTLLSGWITTGPKTREFEAKLSEYCNNTEALGVSSATIGLEMALRWYGIKKGDEVIIPAYTYCATGNVVLRCGAKPVFVDINRDDMLMNMEEVRRKITSRTKAIIPVDFAGLPCDYLTLKQIINSNELKKIFRPGNVIQEKLNRVLIISDAAHSMGAAYYGKKTGSLCDITVFSFHAVKNLTTAEGGAVLFNLPEPFDNRKLYDYFRTFSLHGQTKDALSKTVYGGWKYDVIVPGIKANMTDVLAAIGIVEISRYENDTLVKLKHVFNLYDSLLSSYSWAELPIHSDKKRISAYHIYALRIKGIDESVRDKIINFCHENHVYVNVHFQPLQLHTAYKELGYDVAEVPVSYDSYAREISLPRFYNITDEQIHKVIEVLAEAVSKYRR